jgi:N-acetylglucosaminyldiphosphoundecaprenol N-acetyl-beta-D-mannosaminyltransferase
MRLKQYKIFDETCESLVQELSDHLKLGDAKHTKVLSCMNPHSYYMAESDEEYRHSLLKSDWLLPDGSGIVLASHLLSAKKKFRKISAFDVFERLSNELNDQQSARVFFLGSTDETLKKISKKYQTDYPNITIAGAYSPPFETKMSDAVNQVILNKLKECSPDIIWVGLSAPKQEKWMINNRDQTGAKLAFGIGAVFDFYAGTVQRSSPMFRRVGLEWLPRLIQEPRRLWRRTFVSAPYFIGSVLKIATLNFLCRK